MEDPAVRRRLTAILSADAAGYTRLMASDEVATVRTLVAARERIAALVSRHRGRVVDSPGDNVLAEFPSATDAVRSGIEIQEAIGQLNEGLFPDARMLFRIGIHLGEVIADGDRIYGDGINVASRIEALAVPGELAISGDVHSQVASKLDMLYEDLGLQSLKNFPKPVRVFRVAAAGQRATPGVERDRPIIATRRRVAGIVGVLAAGLAAIWLWSGSPSPPSGKGQIHSLAVLPLDNLSGSPDYEYFADGMTEALIGELSQLDSIKVISRTSVMQYKGARRSLPDIAGELGVDAVIEGSVARSDERVRVTAQLIDARSDTHLRTGRYDRDLRDVLMLQAEVASEIARQIQLELAPQESRPLRTVRQVDAMAHDKYLWGLFHLRARDAEQALGAFAEATTFDPNYAEAYAGIADSHLEQALDWNRPISPREAFPAAKAAASRTLELDPNLASGHAALGWVQLLYEWDWDGAAASFRRALELSPNDLSALNGSAAYHSSRARHEEAVDFARRAAEVAPMDPLTRYNLALTLVRSRRYEEALAQAERTRRIDPSFWQTYGWTGWLPHLRNGELALAKGEFERWRARSNTPDPQSDQAASSPTPLDSNAHWRHWLDQLAREGGDPDPYLSAVLHANLGENDVAFGWLERCFEQRLPALAHLEVAPALDPLREDARFGELLERVREPA